MDGGGSGVAADAVAVLVFKRRCFVCQRFWTKNISASVKKVQFPLIDAGLGDRDGDCRVVDGVSIRPARLGLSRRSHPPSHSLLFLKGLLYSLFLFNFDCLRLLCCRSAINFVSLWYALSSDCHFL
jgi:hypothetical protein